MAMGGGEFASVRRRSALAASLLCLAAALVWPLPQAATVSVAAHMLQVLALLDLAPCLLAIALGPRRFPWPCGAAALAHAAVLWGWHAPAALRATALDAPLRTAMLATLLAAGAAFWLAVPRPGHEAPGLAWTFIAMLHGGLLGALVTFAPADLYGGVCSANAWLTPAEDQQVAGMIMWVGGGAVSMAAGLVLTARLLVPAMGPATIGEVQPASRDPTSPGQ
ncbi:MAG: cytochrome c oxidase assembly protein [Alphaproteobacteria bacterium]|nr:cytochrome c oxidase assembly protein [Alphaproteobacteria bacterium]